MMALVRCDRPPAGSDHRDRRRGPAIVPTGLLVLRGQLPLPGDNGKQHLVLALAATGAAACESLSRSLPRNAGAGEGPAEADLIRATERERLRALVEANLVRARQLHADDFQLINPLGGALSKEQYLGGIGSGELDYLFWEPDSIAVRLYGEAAVIRYPSHLEITVQGRHVPRPAVLAHRPI